MNILSKTFDIARSPGDPEILESGPSSRSRSDNAGKALGWFSIGLGLTELFAAKHLARALGVEGQEALIRAFGARELAHGVACLSVDTPVGVWSRVGGDALDVAALLAAFNDDNPKKQNVALALAAVAGTALLDLAVAQALTARHSRSRGEQRDYSDRSGWPRGEAASRGVAADFKSPADMQAGPQAAAASTTDGRTSPASEGMERTLESAG